MAYYRKKSITIEAVKYEGDANCLKIFPEDEVKDILEDVNDRGNPCLKIPTLEGIMIASKGDYIIRGVRGEYYPCKPDIFNMTYDPYLDVTDDELAEAAYLGQTFIDSEVNASQKVDNTKSQTSVEWFVEQIIRKHPIITQFLPNYNFDEQMIQQAKQMEVRRLNECWNVAHQAGRFEGKGIAEENWQTFEHYYNETYGK